MESLLKKRRLLKLNLQRCRDSMSTILAQKTFDFVGVSKLEILLEQEYHTLKESFRNLVSELYEHLDSEKEDDAKIIEQLLKESDNYRDTAVHVGAKIKQINKGLSKESTRRSLLQNPGNLNESSSRSNDNQPKLKRIDVPTFDGNLQRFYNFKSLFENLVHNNESLSNVQKLYYLKEALVGPANSIVKDFELSDDSYPEAWSYFLARYDNRRAIIRDYFRELKNLTPIKSESQIRCLIDSVNGIIRGLKAAGEKIDEIFSRYIAYHVSSILDPITTKDWENSLTSCKSFPTFEKLDKFLQIRTFAVEERNKESNLSKEPKKPSGERKAFLVQKSGCVVCGTDHRLIDCMQFVRLTPQERFAIIKKNSLCLNCFNRNYTASQCSRSGCKNCSKKHHLLLHFETKPVTADAKKPVDSSETKPAEKSSSLSCYRSPSANCFILLPTAVANFSCNQFRGSARIFLDSCSQPCLISDAFVRKHRLPTYLSNCAPVSGIGGTITSGMKSAFRISSRFGNFELSLEADVVPHSSISYKVQNLSAPSLHRRIGHLQLADPAFYNLSVDILDVDIILGAVFFELCMMDEKMVIEGTFLRRSHFGRVLSGPVEQLSSTQINTSSNVAFCGYATQKVDSIIEKFWQIEEIPIDKPSPSIEEEECNRHFETTVRRDPQNGSFVVCLLFNENKSRSVNNFSQAVASFSRVEKNLSSSPDLKRQYIEFMQEYENLNHMSLVPIADNIPDAYYCPHRAVIRPDSVTTKVRVVFNASSKTRSGLSLNDTLMKGPTLQQDLFDILLVFRQYFVAFVADIEKMYRCILVDNCDRKYQRIVWRENVSEPFKEYELNTLTYGTKPASFIATKCLTMVATDLLKSNKQSQAAYFIANGFYMDDLLASRSFTTAERHSRGIIIGSLPFTEIQVKFAGLYGEH